MSSCHPDTPRPYGKSLVCFIPSVSLLYFTLLFCSILKIIVFAYKCICENSSLRIIIIWIGRRTLHNSIHCMFWDAWLRVRSISMRKCAMNGYHKYVSVHARVFCIVETNVNFKRLSSHVHLKRISNIRRDGHKRGIFVVYFFFIFLLWLLFFLFFCSKP